ncbi:8-oxo-dGTP diphosphatase MutT [Nitrospira sp.]|uniref:8-oxo-dGTP diphosphatase MutT n=1 Tax=Nitrospira sp. TaxID=70125 RepID=UPI003FCD9B03
MAAAIICRKDMILLARRKPESHLGGLWEFPGGKKEVGETLEDCLRREVREELGVDISEPLPFHALHYQYPEKVVELNFFTCSIIQGIPQALECAEITWVYKHELNSFAFPPADIPVVHKILQSGYLAE